MRNSYTNLKKAFCLLVTGLTCLLFSELWAGNIFEAAQEKTSSTKRALFSMY